jgi:hypothetical protein
VVLSATWSGVIFTPAEEERISVSSASVTEVDSAIDFSDLESWLISGKTADF